MIDIKNTLGMKFPDEFVTRFFFKEGLQNQPGKVLELGCANGNNLNLFQEFGWQVTGIDIDPSALEYAKKNFMQNHGENHGANFFQYDIANGVPDINETYDAVIFPNILCYISSEKMIACLRQCSVLLKPKAYFFIRSRTLGDYRYARGIEVEPNGYVFQSNETGEQGLLNVFYSEHVLVQHVMNHLEADPQSIQVMRVQFDNLQSGKMILNNDIVVWGRKA